MVSRKSFGSMGYLISAFIFTLVYVKSGHPDSLLTTLWVLACFKRFMEIAFVHIWSRTESELFNALCEWTFLFGFANNISNSVYNDKDYVPPEDIWRYTGMAIFMTSMSLNAYIHLCLRAYKLRNGGNKVIPRGIFFNRISCPHMLFEILAWIGFSLIA